MSHPQNPYYTPDQTGYRPRNGLGVAALVLGLVGLVVGFFMVTFGFALFLGVLGLIFGLIALRRVKKRIASNKGVSLAGVVLSVLSIVIGIIGAVVTFNAVDDAVSSMSTPTDSSAAPIDPADPAAPAAAFPGATSKDKVLQAGEQIDADGVLMTAGQLVPGDDTLGKTLCSTVSYTNNSKEAASFNGGFDWKLQDPNGVILMNTYGGSDNELKSGELAPGGTMSADVCFGAPATDTPGTYVVLLDPSFRFSSDRIAWLNII